MQLGMARKQLGLAQIQLGMARKQPGIDTYGSKAVGVGPNTNPMTTKAKSVAAIKSLMPVVKVNPAPNPLQAFASPPKGFPTGKANFFYGTSKQGGASQTSPIKDLHPHAPNPSLAGTHWFSDPYAGFGNYEFANPYADLFHFASPEVQLQNDLLYQRLMYYLLMNSLYSQSPYDQYYDPSYPSIMPNYYY